MNLIIRDAIESDYESLCELFGQADELHREQIPHIIQKPVGRSRDKTYVDNLLDDSNTGLFVAEIEQRLVGLICCFIRAADTFYCKDLKRRLCLIFKQIRSNFFSTIHRLFMSPVFNFFCISR